MSYQLRDGFSTTISLPALGNDIPAELNLWEKTVTAPGLDGGGAIEIATMRNRQWRTKSSKYLMTLGDLNLTVAYDPTTFGILVGDVDAGIINANTVYNVFFPDGTYLSFYAYMDKFTPQEKKEGEQPLASVTIIPTMCDYGEYPNGIDPEEYDLGVDRITSPLSYREDDDKANYPRALSNVAY